MTAVAVRGGQVRERIAAAAARAGRAAEDVTLVAVTKDVPLDLVAEAVRSGIADLGENRAQDLARRMATLTSDVRWHYLGAVQTNKVRLLEGVHLVHGVARLREAEALETGATRRGRPWDVLVEVNVAGEATKRGVGEEELGGVLEGLGAYPHVRVRGLMIVAPQVENNEDVRWVFARARELRDTWLNDVPTLRELSMGMSDDYEIAIEEGATIVRIGRAIFGQDRPEAAPARGRMA